MHHQVGTVIVTGLLMLNSPKNESFHSSINQRFCPAKNSLFQAQKGDQFFADESGVLWRALSESGGFCNQIYTSVNDEDNGKEEEELKIMKLYSDLAMKRMTLSGNQDFDVAMGDMGIGPTILKSTESYVIMEKLSGRVLSNEDLLTPIDLQSVARSLAKLHCVKISFENERKTNMLWLCCNALLEQLQEREDELYHMFSEELRQQQLVLEALRLPLAVGHGDFKPSNVILLDDSGDAKLIDWETCGLHYRAFDLAKFFRAVEPRTKEERKFLSRNHFDFINSYCKAIGESAGESVDEPSWVLLESRLLLPMTWLEAALFFHCKSYDKGSALGLYADYAKQRLVSYRKSLKQWEIDLNVYQSFLA